MLKVKRDFSSYRRSVNLLAAMLLSCGVLFYVLRSLSGSLNDWQALALESIELAAGESSDDADLEIAAARSLSEDSAAEAVRSAASRSLIDSRRNPAAGAAPIPGDSSAADAVTPAAAVNASGKGLVLPADFDGPLGAEIKAAEKYSLDAAERPEFRISMIPPPKKTGILSELDPTETLTSGLGAPSDSRTLAGPANELSDPLSLSPPASPTVATSEQNDREAAAIEVLAPAENVGLPDQPAVAEKLGATDPAPASPTVETPAAEAVEVTLDSVPESTQPSRVEQVQVEQVQGRMFGAMSRALQTGFYGGYEISYLSALDDGQAGVVLRDESGGRAYGQDADESSGIGQRVWLGLQSPEGMSRGVRVGYWVFDGSSSADGAFDSTLQPVAFRGLSELEATAVDIEVLQPFVWGGSNLAVSFGGRYADYAQSDTVVGFGELGGIRLTSLSNALRELQAYGFTASLEGVHPLHLPFAAGWCGHNNCPTCGTWAGGDLRSSAGLFWFWNVRGAALFGESKAVALTEATALIPGSPADGDSERILDTVANDDESGLGSFELRLGLEYRRPLRFLPSYLVFRGGLEYRRWDVGSVTAESASFASLADVDLDTESAAAAYARIRDEPLELLGVALSAGLYY